MSDRYPSGYRHMNGYGSHTFSFINAQNERHWVKISFQTAQGIKNFSNDEAAQYEIRWIWISPSAIWLKPLTGVIFQMERESADHDKEEAKTYRYNPFDLTKVWSHKDFPLIDLGVMELNENLKTIFASIEQAAFAPALVVDGISYSPDKNVTGTFIFLIPMHTVTAWAPTMNRYR